MRKEPIKHLLCKFLNCLIQDFFCFIFIQIGQLIFQSVEISFHRGIVIKISGLAHTLCYMHGFAEFYKFPGCKLAALVRMQDQFPFYCRLPVQCLSQCPDCKATCHMAICYAGNNTPVVQVQNRAVVTDFMLPTKQAGKICAPFLIGFLCCKVLLEFIFKYLMWSATFILCFFGRTMDLRPSMEFLYLCTVVRLYTNPSRARYTCMVRYPSTP